ncbi:MAG: hypothetical protein NVS1B4_09330 [Gemmatimonadaceae bacterium]
MAAFRRLGIQLSEAPTSSELLDALRRELHRVRGTAGTFGFPEASRLAGVLEDRTIEWSTDPALDVERRAAVIDHFATALSLAFDETPGAGGSEAASGWRRILAVDIPEAVSEVLRAEGSLRGYSLVARSLVDSRAGSSSDAAPHVVIASGRARRWAAALAAAASAPLVILAAPGDGGFGAAGNGEGGDVTVLSVDTDPRLLFEIAERAASRATAAGGTVLVVDDDHSILAIVRHLLEEVGLRVETLAEAGQLEETIARSAPSLVLMDIEMPGYDGMALTRRLRANPALADLPVILFSSRSDTRTRETAYRAGADEFVPKPIAAAELKSRIANRLERERLRRLAAGLHPATGIATPPRSEREAATRFAAARQGGEAVTLALIRPIGALPSAQEPAWLRETSRLATALPGAGYGAGLTLIVVFAGEFDAAADTLIALQNTRPGDAPPWHVSIVAADDVGGDDFAAVRRAGQTLSDAAKPDGPLLTRWTPVAMDAAPDVVVVEDDPALSGMLQYALRATGFSFRTFDNGAKALEALLVMETVGRKPVLLLDVDLPGMDGFTVHERLRVERPGAFAVVYSTVHAAETEQLRAYRAGAVDYLTKPLNVRVLMAKIPIWLGRTGRAS